MNSKKFAALAILALCMIAPFAEAYVQPEFGWRYGAIGEYVFSKKALYGDDELSRLDWDYRVFSLGLRGGYEKDGFLLEGFFDFGIPSRSGTLADSDWLNIGQQGAEDFQYKTNYSEHENSIRSDFRLGLAAGRQIHVGREAKVTPFAAFDYSCVQFEAKDGWYRYGKNLGPYYADYISSEAKDLSGSVLKYRRHTAALWLGAQAEFDFARRFVWGIGAAISPYTHTLSVDEHIATKMRYTDTADGFFKARKFKLLLGCKIFERTQLRLEFCYLKIPVLTGKSYNTTGENSYLQSKVEGGAGQEHTEIVVSVRQYFN